MAEENPSPNPAAGADVEALVERATRLMSEVDAKLASFEERMKTVELRSQADSNTISQFSGMVPEIRTKVADSEEVHGKFAATIAANHDELAQLFSSLADRVEGQSQILQNAVTSLEKNAEEHLSIGDMLTTLSARIAELEAKVGVIEQAPAIATDV